MSSRVLRIAGAAVIAVYFVIILRDLPSMRFELDDPGNIWVYWNAGFRRVLLANLTFWSSFYRPLGGLWYLTLYSLAKLHPLTYHLSRVPILAANVWLSWRLARDLSGSAAVGWLTAILMSYQGSMAGIYYSNDFIYDLLCYSFFYGAFALYAHIRLGGRFLSGLETAGFLAFYICSLNAKEIGFTLPLLIFLFELFYDPPGDKGVRAWQQWSIPHARVALMGAGCAAIYFLGKRFGENSLFNDASYRPTFTWHQLWERQTAFWRAWLDPWLHRAPLITPGRVMLLYAVLVVASALRKNRRIGIALAIGILSTLPITFIPFREGPATYVPAFGWAFLAAIAVASVTDLLAGTLPLAANSRLAVRTLVFCALLAVIWRGNERERRFQVNYFHPHQAKVSDVIVEFENHAPPIRSKSNVLITDDPFPGAWDASLIARLWYADKSLDFTLGNMMQPKPTPADYEKFDYVLGFTPAGALVELKPSAERASTVQDYWRCTLLGICTCATAWSVEASRAAALR